MRWLHRGRWHPLIPEWWRTATMLVVPITPIIVGVDYLFGHGDAPARLSAVEKSISLSALGVILIASGVITVIGFVGRWRMLTIGGLHWSAAVMSTIGIGIATAPGMGGGFRVPWLYMAIAIASWASAFGYFMQGDPDDDADRPE